MPDIRPPAVAGQFYPASKSALREKIKESFTHRLGPGEIPQLDSDKRKVLGGIVPHAGYEFSGPIAAHVYGEIVKGGFPETFIIIGPKHPDPFAAGSTPHAAITKESFETPFGEVPVNKDLAEKIIQGPIKIDSDMHASEHSIEVQLPFLQYFQEEIDFVPICISTQNYSIGREIGKILKKAIERKEVTIIASTDFSHCGSRYRQKPPEGKNPEEFAEEQDMKAIEEIKNLDAKAFSQIVEKNNISMCGPGGVIALIIALKEKISTIDLLKYATSQEITSGTDAVGYGGISFR